MKIKIVNTYELSLYLAIDNGIFVVIYSVIKKNRNIQFKNEMKRLYFYLHSILDFECLEDDILGNFIFNR